MSEIVLVTGSNGQLGREFQVLSSSYPEFEFHFFDRITLDIQDQKILTNAFQSIKPDYFLNCAAYTAVDNAEEAEETAFNINEIAVEKIAQLCQEYNTKLFHFSTDYVFDGKKNTAYNEEDIENPINVYGKSKLAGEKTLEKYPNAIVIRTSWLYSSFGKNFVKSMLRLAENRNELRVVSDQIGTPTYARDLAKMTLENLNKLGEIGTSVYHYSNEGVASWYDFAHAIFELSDKKITLYPIKTKDYPTPASRPLFTLLDKEKIHSVIKKNIPHWRDSLRKCLHEIKENDE